LAVGVLGVVKLAEEGGDGVGAGVLEQDGLLDTFQAAEGGEFGAAALGAENLEGAGGGEAGFAQGDGQVFAAKEGVDQSVVSCDGYWGK
jgi:hypothetical protein